MCCLCVCVTVICVTVLCARCHAAAPAACAFVRDARILCVFERSQPRWEEYYICRQRVHARGASPESLRPWRREGYGCSTAHLGRNRGRPSRAAAVDLW